jgi:predicted O-methyltransferase YrrM
MGVDRLIQRRFRLSHRDSLPLIAKRGGREALAALFAELGYLRGVEVGTSVGRYAEVLCQANPNLHLTCVDPWKAGGEGGQKRQDLIYKRAVRRLSPFSTTIMRMTSMEAVGSFVDESLDFVYIDGDHAFDSVMCDLIFWSKKVRTGGMVAGHDYLYYPDVFRAVQAYVSCHINISPWYAVRESAHGSIGGSFFWVVKR